MLNIITLVNKKFYICATCRFFNYFYTDMQDFGQLSSKTVTEVLMLEMKMSPGAKVFLVSGYPRNMRDVVEYAEKVSVSYLVLKGILK